MVGMPLSFYSTKSQYISDLVNVIKMKFFTRGQDRILDFQIQY